MNGEMSAERAVLLVHGAWHGAWCWDEWAEGLSGAGHRPVAISLPGHDQPGSKRRIWNRLGQYVDAVGAEIERSGPATVVIGHSMGGLVVQRALERHAAALGVLVASVPRRGVWGATMRTARRAPGPFLRANGGLSMYPIVSTPDLARAAFFSDSAPEDVVAASYARLQNESYLAYVQMFGVLPRPSRVEVPVRVIAGSLDKIFSVREEQQLAAAYGTEAVVIEGAGHDLMLDPAGRPALDHILGWLRDLDS